MTITLPDCDSEESGSPYAGSGGCDDSPRSPLDGYAGCLPGRVPGDLQNLAGSGAGNGAYGSHGNSGLALLMLIAAGIYFAKD